MTLPTSMRNALKEAAKVAATVGPVLATLAAVLPDLHVPAIDTAIVTGVAAALAGFVKWANENQITTTLVRFLNR